MRTALLVGCVLVARVGIAQSPVDPIPVARLHRDQRVVLWSPHFDEEQQPPNGMLDCPSPPPRVYGFELPAGRGDMATLRIRVIRTGYVRDGVQISQNLGGALVDVTHRLKDSVFIAVRDVFRGQADSNGVVEFTAPAGVYQLRVRSIGFTRGIAAVRLRAGARDSIHVWLDPMVIC